MVLRLEVSDEPLALARQTVALEPAPHGVKQLLGVPGLRDEVIDVRGVDRFHQRVGVGEAGEEDPHRVGRDVAAPGEQVRPAHAGHPLVADDQGDRLRQQHLDRLVGPLRAKDLVVARQEGFERVEDPGLVIDQQHDLTVAQRYLERLSGTETVKVAPPLGVFSARIWPPCFFTIS